MSVQTMGKMGNDICPNFLQPLLENFDRMSCNDGCRELIPIVRNPHRKGRPSLSVMAHILEYFVGTPSWATSSGMEKVRTKIQETRELNVALPWG